jgi:uncharacterized protein YPO0396
MVTSQGQGELLDLAAPDERAGFRLQRLELLNWGTFDGSSCLTDAYNMHILAS